MYHSSVQWRKCVMFGSIILFIILNCRRDRNVLCTWVLWQDVNLVSRMGGDVSKMLFAVRCLVSAILVCWFSPNIGSSPHFQKNLLAFLILWSCPVFFCRDLNGSSGVVTPCHWASGSDVSELRGPLAFSGLLDPGDEGSTALRNVEKHPHNHTASRLRRLVSLAAPLQCLAICRLQYLSAVTVRPSSWLA